MGYCAGCGKPLAEGGRFCAFCGAAASLPQTRPLMPLDAGASSPAPVTAAVETKRGGVLAVNALAFAFLLEVVFAVAGGGATLGQVVAVVAFGTGAAYIVLSLRAWKKLNATIKGSAIAWLAASFMIPVCLGNLMSLAIGDGTTYGVSPPASTAPSPASSGGEASYEQRIRPDTKTFVLQSVSLDFNWRKGAFDEVMIANFTLHNPTQYRFKDFEIKCTHSAPSGTVIDSNTRTIYEVVDPNSAKKVPNMNMGFIHSQVTRSVCQITDLVVLP